MQKWEFHGSKFNCIKQGTFGFLCNLASIIPNLSYNHPSMFLALPSSILCLSFTVEWFADARFIKTILNYFALAV